MGVMYWRMVVDIYELSVGYDYPVVRHIFTGRTPEEARAYFQAHLETDEFMRGCVEQRRWRDVVCAPVIRLVPPGEALLGGRADYNDPLSFDPIELFIGTVHELEHTQDSNIAREIAMDHLAEDAAYYQRLERMERGG